MRKILLLLLLFPILIMAQSGNQNGTYKFDLVKKKHKQVDSTATQSDDDDEETAPAPKPAKKPASHKYDYYSYDFANEGVFKGTFNAGLNACQVDGDNEWGYKYFGAEFGAGTIARVHKYLSIGLEVDYSMKGAKARVNTIDNPNYYQVQWDYVQAPISLTGHIRNFLMISVGVSPAYMVRYKELNIQGINVTNDPPLGQPRKFDLEAFAQIYYVFKKHYSLGFKYSYSTIKIREPLSYTKVNGQYNNVLNIRFMYILGPVKKKK